MSHYRRIVLVCTLMLYGTLHGVLYGVPAIWAQEKSVKPGINDPFRDPDPTEFLAKFEVESREVFARRHDIVAACQIEPGQTVADIGAGTGIFTRLFSTAVGQDGRVIAVDIAQKFLDHIRETSRTAGLRNVETILCNADSTELRPDSVDVAFICDTYHHFEFPHKTMASLFRALKPGGRVVLIDFRRVEGSTDWVMNHVRAGQETFEAEILQSGLRKIRDDQAMMKENYFVVFEKSKPSELVYPIISQHGGVLPRPDAPAQPQAGAKVVMDATSAAKPTDVNKGLERAARLLNLYGAAGLKAQDLKLALVLHGEAIQSVLSDQAFKQRHQIERNPNLPLIRELQKAGVEVFVCGQALNYKGILDSEVAKGIPIAASALTVVINKQTEGYAYVPIP